MSHRGVWDYRKRSIVLVIRSQRQEKFPEAGWTLGRARVVSRGLARRVWCGACWGIDRWRRGKAMRISLYKGVTWAGQQRSLQAPLLVLILPHCHIKNSTYLVFCRTPIYSNYSKAALPYIASTLFKVFRVKLLLFLLYIPSNFLFYYRKSTLYSPL